jgi:NAD(P)-dependent dehydrogenase (short-subunit alcohol dehydrogenase family)
VTLAGRVALITGAGNGMGAEHSRELARRGAAVGLADVELESAEAVAREIQTAGGRALACRSDVRDASSVETLVETIAREFGGIDIVISNAGVGDAGGGLADTTDKGWHEQFAVHVDGAFYLTRAALPWLERSEHGRIILISSEWAQRGPGFAHGYCAAKGALLAFARNLAVELAPRRIRVNAIAPATIATRMTAEEDLDEIAATIPVGRVGQPHDVSAAVAFLASDEADFITGQTLAVNGGVVISGS